MSEEGEFRKRFNGRTVSAEVSSNREDELMVRTVDLVEILEAAKQDFPKKEDTKLIGSDGEEHSYETYDTEAVERWFLFWFGLQAIHV